MNCEECESRCRLLTFREPAGNGPERDIPSQCDRALFAAREGDGGLRNRLRLRGFSVAVFVRREMGH